MGVLFVHCQNCFSYWGSHINFRVYLSLSVKAIIGLLIQIALDLYIALDSIDILTIWSSNPWTLEVFQFIYIIFNFFQWCLIVFRVWVFHLLFTKEGNSLVLHSFWCRCRWDFFPNCVCRLVSCVEIMGWLCILQLYWIHY